MFRLVLFFVTLLVLGQGEVVTFSQESQSVDSFRKFVELSNLYLIEQNNKKGNTYLLAANRFIDLTESEFSITYGSLNEHMPQVQEISLPLLGSIYKLSSGRTIDWRAKGKVSQVKNQGTICNACYAFVAIADIETSLLLANKRVRLS